MRNLRSLIATAALLLVSATAAGDQTLGDVTTASGSWKLDYAPDIKDDLDKIYGTPFVTIGNQTIFANERALAVGSLLSMTDGGAGAGITIAVNDAETLCLGGLTSAADKMPYFTGSGTCALADLSSYSRTLLDDTSASAARSTLGLIIGTNVQAWDADLDIWAGKTAPSGTVVGTSDTQTMTGKTMTTPIISLEQSASPSQSAEGRIQWDTDDDRLVIGDGSGTKVIVDVTKLLQVANNLSDLANAGTARTNLGLGALATLAAVASATITDGSVVNADLANMANGSTKCRTTAGTGVPEDCTGAQATALLSAMVGDSGSGGTKGLVPAPAAGDQAAGKFLAAGGTWALPPGAGGGEANTASNVGTAGVGVFKTKSGIDLQFKKINSASGGKITITDDTGNDEVDINAPDASTTQPGACELATTSEAAAQTDTARCVTPQGLAFKPESFCFALSDETTNLTTGNGKVTFVWPFAFTITAVTGSVTAASSSGVVTVDMNEDTDAEGVGASSTTMLSTKLTIDANERRSSTAATAVVISDTSIAANSEITFDQDTAGTTAKGMKVCVVGHQ